MSIEIKKKDIIMSLFEMSCLQMNVGIVSVGAGAASSYIP